MATKSPFDPDQTDPKFYSNNPQQQGNSDYDGESDGVGVGGAGEAPARDRVENKAQETEWDINREAVETGQQTPKVISDEAAQKLRDIPENPSDEALFSRADATYLKPDDNPNEGYDPHNKGYDNNKKEE